VEAALSAALHAINPCPDTRAPAARSPSPSAGARPRGTDDRAESSPSRRCPVDNRRSPAWPGFRSGCGHALLSSAIHRKGALSRHKGARRPRSPP